MGIPDSFLLDEVRCGFLVPAAIKQAWAAELEVLMEIDRVCRKHHIQYFADWGTLLGTVRHGGFIPWDDDLDIVMKRADYEKFMTVARFDMEEGFDVQTFRNQKDFWLFMGKVVGKNRFCFEKEHLRRFHNFPYIACVDIFVLDYVYREPEKEEERRTLCKYLLGVADAIVEGKLSPEEKEQSLRNIEEMSGRKIKRIQDAEELGRMLYGEVERIFAEVPEGEADTLTQLFPWGLKGDAFHFPKECYEEPIYLPFECTTMPVPKLYDKMLRLRYGDYMKLRKDAGAHNYPFFEGQKVNLQKVLDFELPKFRFERAKLCRSEEEKSYKKTSYKAMARECAEELWRMKEQLQTALEEWHPQQAVALLQESQQLAIELGTMLEQMRGESCTVISCLEQYCEALYGLYEQLAEGNGVPGKGGKLCIGLDKLQELILRELEQDVYGRRTVLFLPVLTRDWEGLHSLWQAAEEDLTCDVCVVPLPYYYKDYDGSPKEVRCDAADFPGEVCPLDYKLLTEEYLELLHPEVIVIQNPYDGWNPAISVAPGFYAEKLRKYTDKLVYVPPFHGEDIGDSARAYSNLKYYVPMPGVVYADLVLVSSEQQKQRYLEKLVEFAGEETRTSWEQRIMPLRLPVSEQKQKTSEDRGRRKRILYGISLGTYMEDEEAAQEKMKRSQELFKENQESIEVTLFHFPQEKAVSVKDYDAYYGDPMPLATEFQQAGKPVMIQNIRL